MNPELLELLRRWRNGDETAFEPLADQVARMVYPRALKAVGDHSTADDLTQEVLLRVFRKIGDIEDLKAFEGWLLRMTYNLINDFFRKRTRERQLHESFLELRKKREEGKLSTRARAELAEVLHKALADLDEKHREVFVLKEIEGMSHEQIANRLGIPQGTVWSRLSYARKGLREKLLRRDEGLHPSKVEQSS
jgi:RNA polymerase sigma-70 factor (ECF subfamily)